MRFLIVIVLSILSTVNWGSTGHRVIAEVASNYLTDNARLQIDNILNGETLVNASTYADDIKSDSRYDMYYDWHFLNMENWTMNMKTLLLQKGEMFLLL